MTKKKEADFGNDLEYEIKRLSAVISRLEIENEDVYQRGYARGYKAGYKEAEMNEIYLEDDKDEEK
jgi:flagellar biosynthesis/type III secretory pathway protein FliH